MGICSRRINFLTPSMCLKKKKSSNFLIYLMYLTLLLTTAVSHTCHPFWSWSQVLVQIGKWLHANIHQGTAVNNVLLLDLSCLTVSVLHRGMFGDLLIFRWNGYPLSLYWSLIFLYILSVCLYMCKFKISWSHIVSPSVSTYCIQCCFFSVWRKFWKWILREVEFSCTHSLRWFIREETLVLRLLLCFCLGCLFWFCICH